MKTLTVLLCTCITTTLCGLNYVYKVNQRLEVVKSRKKAHEWLLSQRNRDWGWGTKEFSETHRILTTLYLSGEMKNETESLEYQLSVKQLELELSLGLIREISAGQLGLYANALLATCKDPNNFYEHNVVRIMRHKRKLSVYTRALVSLAFSNSGHLLNKWEILYFIEILNKPQLHMIPDTNAMVIIALSSTMKSYRYYRFIESHLRKPLKAFKKFQKPDGSFGNIYSSALVMQALIAAEDKGEDWNFEKGIDYILSQQKEDGSFSDLLATYFVLPVLAGKSLADLRPVSCNSVNLSSEDNDLEGEEREKYISVRYTVGEKTKWNVSDVFSVPENSSFLDVMEVAQKMDDRYRFSGRSYSWGYYVLTIGNLTNNVACNKYWLLYKVDDMGEEVQTERGVTKDVPENGDHYIFWYVRSPFESLYEENMCEDDQQDSNVTTSPTENNTYSGVDGTTLEI